MAISKKEFVKSVAEKSGVSQADAEAVLNATRGVLVDTVSSEGEFNWAGLGKFKKTHRAARQGRNPQSGETMTIAASTSMSFKPGKETKEKLK